MDMDREPVVTPAVVSAAVAALLALLVAFGLPLTQDQTAAVLGLVAVAAPVVAAVVARRWAYAPRTVRRLTRRAHRGRRWQDGDR